MENFKKPPRVIHMAEKDNKLADKEGEGAEDLEEAERREMEVRQRAREEERERVRKLEMARSGG